MNKLQRAVEVLTLGPCGPLLVRNVRHVTRFVCALHNEGLLKISRRNHMDAQVSVSQQLLQWVIINKIKLGGTALLLWNHRRRARQRARRTACIQAVRRMTKKQRRWLMHATKGELSSWLNHPELEQVRWLNTMLAKLWPYIANTLQTVLDEFARDQVEKELNSHGMEDKFQLSLPVLELGTIAPILKDVTLVDAGTDSEIKLQACVEFAGNPRIVVGVNSKVTPKMSVRLKNFQMVGNVQLTMSPLLSQQPYVGGISILFLEPPSIRYNLSAKPIPGLPNISLQALPGLQEYLDSILKIVICEHMVFPKSLIVPIADSELTGSSIEVKAIGHLMVVVDRARNLPDADWGFMGMGKSDPYVKIGVGAQGQLPPQFKKTRTINDDLNPTWDELFLFKVHSLHLQELVVEVFDEDNAVTGDELLGCCTIDLSNALAGDMQAGKWYTLSSPLVDPNSKADKPQIKLKMTWTPSEGTEEYPTQVNEVKRTPMARAQGVARNLGMGAKVTKFTLLVKRLVRRLNLTTSSGQAECAKFHKLPPWMASPDMDSAHWINEMQGVMWPIVQQFVAEYMAYKNKCQSYDIPVSWISLVHKLDLGSMPLAYIDGIKVISTNEQELIMDIHVSVGGDLEVGSQMTLFNNFLSTSRLELQQINAFLALRLHFKQLIPTLPYAASMSIQVIDEPFVDFKLMIKPSRFLPALDLASIPLFCTMTNFILRKAMQMTIKFPRQVNLPILDVEDPSVYFHMDLAGRVDGMLSVEIGGLTPDNTSKAVRIAHATKDLVLYSMSAGSSIVTLTQTKKPAVYVVATANTRLDEFELLKKRPYADKFQRTKGVAKDLNTDKCRWHEELSYLVESPEHVLLTVGIFVENPYQHQRKFWQGHENCSNLAKVITKATSLQSAFTPKTSVKDIPWSYEFWYHFLSPSMDRDPDNPATWNPAVEVWPGLERRTLRPSQSESDEADEDWQQAVAEFVANTDFQQVEDNKSTPPPSTFDISALISRSFTSAKDALSATPRPAAVGGSPMGPSQALSRSTSYDPQCQKFPEGDQAEAQPLLQSVTKNGGLTRQHSSPSFTNVSSQVMTMGSIMGSFMSAFATRKDDTLGTLQPLPEISTSLDSSNTSSESNAPAPDSIEQQTYHSVGVVSTHEEAETQQKAAVNGNGEESMAQQQSSSAATITDPASLENEKKAAHEAHLKDKAIVKVRDPEETCNSVQRMIATEVAQGSNWLGSAVQKVRAPRSGIPKSVTIPIQCGFLRGSMVDITLQWKAFKPNLDQFRDGVLSCPVKGVLIVHLLKASNLDKASQKPTVELTVGGRKKTSTTGTGMDPKYNEIMLFPDIEISPGNMEMLQIQVKSKTINLGYLSLSLREVIKEGRQYVDSRLTQVHTGTIRLDLTWQELVPES